MAAVVESSEADLSDETASPRPTSSQADAASNSAPPPEVVDADEKEALRPDDATDDPAARAADGADATAITDRSVIAGASPSAEEETDDDSDAALSALRLDRGYALPKRDAGGVLLASTKPPLNLTARGMAPAAPAVPPAPRVVPIARYSWEDDMETARRQMRAPRGRVTLRVPLPLEVVARALGAPPRVTVAGEGRSLTLEIDAAAAAGASAELHRLVLPKLFDAISGARARWKSGCVLVTLDKAIAKKTWHELDVSGPRTG